MDTIDQEARVKRNSKILLWAAGGVGAVVVGPAVLVGAASAFGATIALGLTAATGLTIWKFIPNFVMKLENSSLQNIKDQAAANPIPTMQNSWIKDGEMLRAALLDIQSFEADVRGFDSEYKGLLRDYPDEAPAFKEIVDESHVGLDVAKTAYLEAKTQHEEMAREIKKAERVYKMAQSALRMTRRMGSRADPLERIKKETALFAVEKAKNEAFAALSTKTFELKAMREQPKQPKQLESRTRPVDGVFTVVEDTAKVRK